MRDSRGSVSSLLPWLFAGVFAFTRILPALWPGSLPPNFSAAYALAFCAGALFPGRLGWALPLGLMLFTDVALNVHYQRAFGYHLFAADSLLFLAGNYAGYALLIALGRKFKSTRSFLGLLGGGLMGAILFYLVTNTASWLLNPFRNPEYTRDLAGWLTALTLGTKGHPPTWEFFRNTLLSGGLFTALFAGAWKLTGTREVGEPEVDPTPASTPEPGPELDEMEPKEAPRASG